MLAKKPRMSVMPIQLLVPGAQLPPGSRLSPPSIPGSRYHTGAPDLGALNTSLTMTLSIDGELDGDLVPTIGHVFHTRDVRGLPRFGGSIGANSNGNMEIRPTAIAPSNPRCRLCSRSYLSGCAGVACPKLLTGSSPMAAHSCPWLSVDAPLRAMRDRLVPGHETITAI